MSELLARLDREFQTAATLGQRAEIRAKKGSYLARIGRFEEASDIIRELRREFGDGRSGHVTSWIMLAEGLLYLFKDLSPLALDRVMRSQFLGLAMKDASVIAISSAWKAHIEFETSDFEAMANSLRLAISNSGEQDHDAHARFAMVLSDAFMLCGDNRSAQSWFQHSRDHALRLGDQASIEALQYNRAAFRLARLRATRCMTHIDDEQLSMLRVEIASARNLQMLTGAAALTNFIHLCEARFLILVEHYDQAIDALGKIRGARPFADYNFNQSIVDLEIAFCLKRLNRVDEAREVYKSVLWKSFIGLDVDEQLVAAWMHYSLCEEDQSFGDVHEAKARFDDFSENYERVRLHLIENLRPYQLGV